MKPPSPLVPAAHRHERAVRRRSRIQRIAPRLVLVVLIALGLGICRSGLAFDSIVLTADTVTTPAARARDVRLALDLTGAGKVRAHATAARLDLGRALGRYTALDLACAHLDVSAQRVACRGGQLRASGGIIEPLTLTADAELDTSRGLLAFRASDPAIAGGHARVSGTVTAGHWAIEGHAAALDAAALRKLAGRWVRMLGYTASGRIDADFHAARGKRAIRLGVEARTKGLALSNGTGTIAAEKLAATVGLDAEVAPQAVVWQASVEGREGDLLLGPVLADFRRNPLSLRAHGLASGGALDIDTFSLTQRALVSATGEARLTLGRVTGAAATVEEARVHVARLEFPSAYASFLQLPLASTSFGALQTSGRASGGFEIVNGRPVRIDADVDRLDIKDPAARLAAADLRGALHWAAAGTAAPSFVSLRAGRAHGIEVGPARIDFRMQGLDFRLAREARIPVLDGALVIHSLSAAELGRPDVRLRFDANIEPISMPRLCKAFGWPQMQGSLSGRVPDLAYRNREMTFGGAVVAHVFDGTIRGSNIRLVDPLGPWPRLQASVIARSLDLGLVTRTFPIGSITGRLDADVLGLELFDWSPVAFDAKLYTAPGDRSRHMISQKAVTSLSSLGGGGGIVAAALQSGVLRFFRTFHYDRIGLRCALRNEVCRMAGVEPADDGGYFIVKGRGLPRIDIIGNQGRVNWPQLVSQIISAMHGNDPVIR